MSIVQVTTTKVKNGYIIQYLTEQNAQETIAVEGNNLLVKLTPLLKQLSEPSNKKAMSLPSLDEEEGI